MSEQTEESYFVFLPNWANSFESFASQYDLPEGHAWILTRDNNIPVQSEDYHCLWRAKGIGPDLEQSEHKSSFSLFDAFELIERLDWDWRKSELFMCDCAARVHRLIEKEYPTDNRIKKFLSVRRDFAKGKIGEEGWRIAWKAANSLEWQIRWSVLKPRIMGFPAECMDIYVEQEISCNSCACAAASALSKTINDCTYYAEHAQGKDAWIAGTQGDEEKWQNSQFWAYVNNTAEEVPL